MRHYLRSNSWVHPPPIQQTFERQPLLVRRVETGQKGFANCAQWRALVWLQCMGVFPIEPPKCEQCGAQYGKLRQRAERKRLAKPSLNASPSTQLAIPSTLVSTLAAAPGYEYFYEGSSSGLYFRTLFACALLAPLWCFLFSSAVFERGKTSKIEEAPVQVCSMLQKCNYC